MRKSESLKKKCPNNLKIA